MDKQDSMWNTDSQPTFSLAGHEWKLTEPVKAYLEWFAIEVNYLHESGTYDELCWQDGRLYYSVPEEDAEIDDPEVLEPETAIEAIFEDASEEREWGWIIGCGLTKWPPSQVDIESGMVETTRNRISELITWRIVAGRPVSDNLREFARDVLDSYSSEDWEAAIADDPDLERVKNELEL